LGARSERGHQRYLRGSDLVKIDGKDIMSFDQIKGLSAGAQVGLGYSAAIEPGF